MFIFVLNHLYMLNALWLQATIFVHIINVIISITKIIIIQLVVAANGAIVCYNLKTSVINYYLYKIQDAIICKYWKYFCYDFYYCYCFE